MAISARVHVISGPVDTEQVGDDSGDKHDLHRWLDHRLRCLVEGGDPGDDRAGIQPSTVKLLTSITPTSWATSKLEAIELRSPFIWFDDQPLQFEIEELQECGLRDRCVKVDLLSEPDQLGTLRMFGEW